MSDWKRALDVIPGGVSAPVRSFEAMGIEPVIAARGEGPNLFASDGRKYVDYFMAQGSLIHGHAFPPVVEAIQRAASEGTAFSLTTNAEIELAETIRARVAGVEQVRFVTTGSDATQVAVRIARDATNRTKIVRFLGNYHGNSDTMLSSAMSTGVTPTTSGVPDESNDLYVPYNEVPTLPNDAAAVFVEPIAANMGVVAPVDGFLAGLRGECDRVGAVLIFDEVITGFRVALGGASAFYGVQPDLWCYGKIVGGGLPLAAVAGSRTLMQRLAPVGGVYSSGTAAANPLALAAGLATLNNLEDSSYEMLRGRVNELATNLRRAFADAGVSVQVSVASTLLSLFFGDEQIIDASTARTSVESGMYAQFFRAMLKRGVLLSPSAYGPTFVSLAHTWETIDWTTDLIVAAAAELVN